MRSSASDIRLWHLPTSHFSEKVRWALDFKRVPHTRRVPLAAPHVAVSYVKTRGKSVTFPLLELDGRAIGDSTEALLALEERFPEPPLFPPAIRAEVLATEDWLDAGIGEHVRTLALHDVSHDPSVLAQLADRHRPAHMTPFPRAWRLQFKTYISRRYGLDAPGAIERARAGWETAFSRLEEQLGDRDYLVGDTFTAADITAASHFYWPIQPPEGPRVVDHLPPRLVEFMDSYRDRRGYAYVLNMYARHRLPAAAPSARASAPRAVTA